MAGYKQQESFTSPKHVQSIVLFFQRLFSSVPSNVCVKKHVVPPGLFIPWLEFPWVLIQISLGAVASEHPVSSTLLN